MNKEKIIKFFKFYYLKVKKRSINYKRRKRQQAEYEAYLNTSQIHYKREFLDIAKNHTITDLGDKKDDSELTFDYIFNLMLSNTDLYHEYLDRMYPEKKYYSNIDELVSDGFDIQFFFYAENLNFNLQSVKAARAICVKHKLTDKIYVGYVVPTSGVDVVYEDYFFISSSIYAYYYNTKTIELGGKAESNFGDILKYMESNDISDLHFQLLDEYSYYFTARFGQDIIKITTTPINKDYVDKIYNQALIMIGKDSLSNPPEISGLLKERLLSKNGKLLDRTFRFHSMFDNKGQFQGRAVSIRKLMNYDEISSLGLKGLNYSQRAIDLIHKGSANSHGIVLITGKTNSGKSTLLYCMLAALYEEGRRIKSIESPVEVVAPFSQVDLTATEDAEDKYRMTREIAVSALLRQDPDVVLIQEVRTSEEVEEFIELGLKGHLAYSTIHTGSVQETMLRVLKATDGDQKVLREALKLIITQELIGKKCQTCFGIKKETVCEACNDLGVKGLLPVYEIAYFNDLHHCDLTDLRSVIHEGKIDYISKKDMAREYKEKNWITDKDYDRIMKYEKDLREI